MLLKLFPNPLQDRALHMWYLQDKTAILAVGDAACLKQEDWAKYWINIIKGLDEHLPKARARLDDKVMAVDLVCDAFEKAVAVAGGDAEVDEDAEEEEEQQQECSAATPKKSEAGAGQESSPGAGGSASSSSATSPKNQGQEEESSSVVALRVPDLVSKWWFGVVKREKIEYKPEEKEPGEEELSADSDDTDEYEACAVGDAAAKAPEELAGATATEDGGGAEVGTKVKGKRKTHAKAAKDGTKKANKAKGVEEGAGAGVMVAVDSAVGYDDYEEEEYVDWARIKLGVYGISAKMFQRSVSGAKADCTTALSFKYDRTSDSATFYASRIRHGRKSQVVVTANGLTAGEISSTPPSPCPTLLLTSLLLILHGFR